MKNTFPSIVVLGSINMDLVIRCLGLPVAGQTILAESSAEFCGGKGANQAVAAARAGGDVQMMGAVGNDAFADRLLGSLSRNHIDCRAVARRKDQPSGLAVISVDQAGQNSIIVVAGANASVTHGDVLAAKAMIQRCDLLLVQLEIPIEAVLCGIDIAKQAGVRIVLDPAPAPHEYPPELLNVDLLCPNESEAEELTGLRISSIDDACVAAAKLHDLGAKKVAITLGERGSLLWCEGQSELITGFKIDAVDTTAAGDSFAGALATRWSQTGDLPDAVHFANAAGALAASRHGAQASMATRDEIETLVRSQG